LADIGYVEGNNVAIEYRWAEGQYSRLPAFASDLIRSRAAVILAGAQRTLRHCPPISPDALSCFDGQN
jgi:hypothetical protein